MTKYSQVAGMKKETKESLDFMHSITREHIKNGKKMKEEEQIIVGPRGMSVKYYKKVDDKIKKVHAMQVDKDTVKLKVIKDGETDEKEIPKADLLKELKKLAKDHKELDFAVNYLSKQKGGAKGTKKKGSKKSSKKGSKKGSKKTSSSKKAKKPVKKSSKKSSSKKTTSKKKSSKKK